MSFADHRLINNSLGDTMLDMLEEKRKGDFKICGGTFVNLLGSYGNFEVDSNADGLADGFAVYPDSNSEGLSTPNVSGDYSQKLSGKGTKTYIGGFFEINFIEDHTYLFSAYLYTDKSCFQYQIVTGSGTGTLDPTYYEITSTEYNKWFKLSFKTLCTISGSSRFTVRIKYDDNATQGLATMRIDGLQLIDLTAAGALDPVRQAKYGVTNWADLTEAQLEAEIPYFDSVMSVNVEDGTASELTIENHKDSSLGEICSTIIIPSTCELHALENYHDYIEYDADSEKLLHVSFIARDNKTTDASGDFALTGVLSGSNVLVRNKTTGAVEWCTESSGSVHTSTISDDVEIWYIRSTATSTEIYGLYSGNFLKALKNNIVIDSNLPVAMAINESNQSGYVITQDFTE